jgi:DNA polymerase V
LSNKQKNKIMAVQKVHATEKLEIYSAITESSLELPVVSGGISAGFPSPALDFIDLTIDMNRHLVKHPAATFYGRVKGDSMKDEGIHDGDLLVIDKSLEPADGKIAVCYIDGEFTIKRIRLEKNVCWLMPANDDYKPIKVTEDDEFLIWGIVTHLVKSF